MGQQSGAMSLRLRINCIMAGLTLLFFGIVMVLEVESTRRSVREEIEASSRIATQLLAQIGKISEREGAEPLADTLRRLGRVRGNEVFFYDTDGRLLYSSPPSPYKAGLNAPDWFNRLV